MNKQHIGRKWTLVLTLILAMAGSVWANGSQDEPKETTIQYWNINTDTFGGPQVKTLIESFESDHPGIKVESRSFGDYTTLLQTAETSIAGGNPPAVVQVGYPYLNYVGSSLPYISIEDLVKEYGGEDFLARFPQNILDIPKVGSHQIGMAYSLSIPVTYYNADLMAKAGLDPDNPPTTITGWREAGIKIKEKLGIATILWGYSEDNWTVQGFINSAGGEILNCQNNQARAAFDNPSAIQGLENWQDLINEGYSLDVTNSEARQAFLAGETVAWVHSIAARSGVQRDADFDLRATSYPQHGDHVIRVPGGGNMLIIFAQEDEQKASAWEFVQHLCSPAGFTEWTKGTGYVPLIPGLTDDPAYLAGFVRENPIQQVGIDMLQNAVTWISFPGSNSLAAGRKLFEATQLILSGQATAEAALQKAAKDVNALIGEERCDG